MPAAESAAGDTGNYATAGGGELPEGLEIKRTGRTAMRFKGISRIFSTVNEKQYETIGEFWDEMSGKYGLENLRGLGYNWTGNSIEYVIGLKEGIIDQADCEVVLPDDGWETVCGRTDDLGQIYSRIYADGGLAYEIETFTDAGNCMISFIRLRKER